MVDSATTVDSSNDPSWFVIWAESRAEKKVAERMAAMGLEPWLPIKKERHRWSDRWREVECPLFPGYLFAKAAHADWPRILRTPGVLTLVRHAGKPAVLSGSFVKRLREAIERDDAAPEPVDEMANYAPGHEVTVMEGVLQGIRGFVREKRGGRQLVIWVPEIGRGVAVTIGTALVRALGRGDTR